MIKWGADVILVDILMLLNHQGCQARRTEEVYHLFHGQFYF